MIWWLAIAEASTRRGSCDGKRAIGDRALTFQASGLGRVEARRFGRSLCLSALCGLIQGGGIGALVERPQAVLSSSGAEGQ